MPHQRQLIRKKVVEILKNRTPAASRVVGNPTTPQWADSLPAIFVFPLSESVEEYTQAPRENKRTLQLAIEMVARANQDELLSDQLDEMALKVEDLLGVDDTLGGTAEDILLRSVEMKYLGEGDRPIGAIRNIYEVIYLTAVPKTTEGQDRITDLQAIQTQWDIREGEIPSDGVLEAEDKIIVSP